MQKINYKYFLFVILNLGHPKCFSQSVALDYSFNSGGTVITPVGLDSDVGNEVAVQPDGKTLVAGNSINGSETDFAVIRYNIDGSLDNSFDGDGKAIFNFIGIENDCRALIIQPDGKIVIGGHTFNGTDCDFTIIRLMTNGSLDTSFGSGGIVQEDLSASYWDSVSDLTLQSDGKIIAVGYSAGGLVAIKRFNSNGILDTSFNEEALPLEFEVGSGSSVIIQSDGRIVMIAEISIITGSGNLVVRYNSDGSFDTTFNSIGYMTLEFGYMVRAQIDDKLIISGYNNDGLIRLNPNGSFDNTFGIGGKAYTSFFGSINLQLDGKIILAGTEPYSPYNFVLERYFANGTIDTTFGSNGMAVADFGTSTFYTPSALMNDGRIVVAGYNDVNGTNDFAVARFNANAVNVPEHKAENSFNVYPNPNNGSFKIDLKEPVRGTLEIMNSFGQLVFTKEIMNESSINLNLSSSSKGIYFVSIQSETGISNAKIIIEY